MTATYVLILLLTGAGAGFTSGLLGIGGGIILVPAIWWIADLMGFGLFSMKIAIATSAAVILPTALSGVWRHNKKKAVRWRAALILGPCGATGSILLGARIADKLPNDILKIVFGILLLVIAAWMGIGKTRALRNVKVEKEGHTKMNPFALAALGFPVGVLAGLAGIGGGAVMVPAMVLALGFVMHEAVGTSTGAVVFISMGSIIYWIVNSQGITETLPPYSIGYINGLMWLCLVVTSIPMAQLGAKLAHALPAKKLQYIFIALLIYLGLRMLGVFG
jgi:uncharacterized membrane protein YfcA